MVDTRNGVEDIPMEYVMSQAAFGAGFTCRMFRDNPANTPEMVAIWEWAEKEFVRIANKHVDSGDLFG